MKPNSTISLVRCILSVASIFFFMKIMADESVDRFRSAWDKDILNLSLRNVQIGPVTSIEQAWYEISTKYLLRVNLYLGNEVTETSGLFSLSKQITTGRELLEAFFTAFPAYTFTQDQETGVIWIHPKRIRYDSILNKKVNISSSVHQILASKFVLPLCSALSITPTESAWSSASALKFFIDLPVGVYSARDVFNFCCCANPTKAFVFFQKDKTEFMTPVNLIYENPFATPRSSALGFWAIEVGNPKSSNGIPSIEEISFAMSDINPRKRWAARSYLEAAKVNYNWRELLAQGDDPGKIVWTAVGIDAVIFRGINGAKPFSFMGKYITNSLENIRDPSLALIALLELARDQKDNSYFDSIVRKHKFSEEEISTISPDIYRLFNTSQLVRDKMKALEIEAPRVTLQILEQLESRVDLYDVTSNPSSQETRLALQNRNLFTIVTEEQR